LVELGQSGLSKYGSSRSGMSKFVSMTPESKGNLMLALAIVGLLLLTAQFLGMIYFAAHPDVMNVTFVSSEWWATILVLMGIAGVVCLISLAYNKKDYFGARVIGALVLLGGMVALYLWWYKLIPFLY
jgi:hypothetical protein